MKNMYNGKEKSGMLCYRDMTFCTNKECTNKECRRKLTEEICRQADEFGLPLCVADFNCEQEKEV